MFKSIIGELKEGFGEFKSGINSDKRFFCFIFGLAVLFVLSMFFEPVVVVAILAMIAVSVIFDYEKTLCLFLFSLPFYSVISIGYTFLFEYVYFILFFICTVKYIIELFRHGKSLNLKVLVPILVFLFYISLPFYKVKVFDALSFLTAMSVLYVTLENKKNINFKKLVAVASVGLILSALVSFLVPCTERMPKLIVYAYKYNFGSKFCGLLTNPNIFAVLAIFLMSSIIYFCLKKGGIIWFLPLIILLIFGFKTLSRGFFIGLILVIVYFLIASCARKDKRMIIGFCFVALCATMIAVLELELNNILTSLGFIKKEIDFKDTTMNPENWEFWVELWEDGLPIDPGRILIWQRYLKRFISSPVNLIFGEGISAEVLGISAHSFYIQFLWSFGILGFAVACYSFLPVLVRLFKNFKNDMVNSLTLSILFVAAIEGLFFGDCFVFALILFVSAGQNFDDENNKKIVHNLNYKSNKFCL